MNTALIEKMVDEFVGNRIKGFCDVEGFFNYYNVDYKANNFKYDEKSGIVSITYKLLDDISVIIKVDEISGIVLQLEFLL